MRPSVFLGIVVCLLIYAPTVTPTRAAVAGRTLAIGYPNSGRLVGGRRFRETHYMKSLSARANSPAKWALPALLDMLDRASRVVANRYPGSVLLVGELSNRDGGPIASHRSHQSGRDVDVAFYLVNDRGRAVRQPHYVHCDRRGGAISDEPMRFDLKRNWTLIRALLEDKHATVMQIFVYAPLRARLLDYAERTGAPGWLQARAAAVMAQPANAEPHDDHFHVRIACPADQIDLGCIDHACAREGCADAARGGNPVGRAEAPGYGESEPLSSSNIGHETRHSPLRGTRSNANNPH